MISNIKIKNITLVTSIIKPPNTALSYWYTRSIYSNETRFEQTKHTIQTIRNKIQDNLIILVECSPLSKDETNYFLHHTDIFINLYDDIDERLNIHSASKALGEGTMTKAAFKYLFENNILYENFFKITGRYWLNENFNLQNFETPKSVLKFIDNNPNNMLTSLYNISYIHSILWYDYLLESTESMIACRNYEHIFADFINTLPKDEYQSINKIGVSGNWAPTGDLVDE